LAPVLIVGVEPLRLWYQTVPVPGMLFTSLNPQTRRILRPLVCKCDITKSTSALFGRKPIQYEFVPAKYPVLPSILNNVPKVFAKDPEGMLVVVALDVVIL